MLIPSMKEVKIVALPFGSPLNNTEIGIFETFSVNVQKYKDEFTLEIPLLEHHLERLETDCREYFNKLILIDKKSVFSTIFSFYKDTLTSDEYRGRFWINQNEKDFSIYFTLDYFRNRFLQINTNDSPKAHLCSFNRSRENSYFKSSIKFTPATVSIESSNFALQNKFHESLLLNADQFITESSWSNFFWIIDDDIFTSSYGLKGIVQKILLLELSSKFSVKRAEISIIELKKKRVPCFITNSLHGVVEVEKIDDTWLEKSKNISIINDIYNSYRKNHTAKWEYNI